MMSNNPKIYRELYLFLRALLPASALEGNRSLGCLTAPGKPSIQYRAEVRLNGSIRVTLVRLDRSGADVGAAPDPLIQLNVFPSTRVAEVRRLVHHADYRLEPVTARGQVRPLVMRIALAYVKRWLGERAAEGYRCEHSGNPRKRDSGGQSRTCYRASSSAG